MNKVLILLSVVVLISVSACKKKKEETPVTPPSTGGGGGGGGADYYKVGTTTYSPDKTLTMGGVDPSDDILTITTQPANNSLIQISAFDTLYDANMQLTSSRTYQLAQSVSTWPSPSFGKATFELVENVSLPNETIWIPTSGTLTITKNSDGTFTATLSNVPVKIDVSATTSTVSGKIAY